MYDGDVKGYARVEKGVTMLLALLPATVLVAVAAELMQIVVVSRSLNIGYVVSQAIVI